MARHECCERIRSHTTSTYHACVPRSNKRNLLASYSSCAGDEYTSEGSRIVSWLITLFLQKRVNRIRFWWINKQTVNCTCLILVDRYVIQTRNSQRCLGETSFQGGQTHGGNFPHHLLPQPPSPSFPYPLRQEVADKQVYGTFPIGIWGVGPVAKAFGTAMWVTILVLIRLKF